MDLLGKYSQEYKINSIVIGHFRLKKHTISIQLNWSTDECVIFRMA